MAYMVRTNQTEKGKERQFSSHKSARSFARRNIREGADWALILHTTEAGDEALKNVYQAVVDKEAHTRSHRRIPVDDFRNMVAQQEAKATEAKKAHQRR